MRYAFVFVSYKANVISEKHKLWRVKISQSLALIRGIVSNVFSIQWFFEVNRKNLIHVNLIGEKSRSKFFDVSWLVQKGKNALMKQNTK